RAAEQRHAAEAVYRAADGTRPGRDVFQCAAGEDRAGDVPAGQDIDLAPKVYRGGDGRSAGCDCQRLFGVKGQSGAGLPRADGYVTHSKSPSRCQARTPTFAVVLWRSNLCTIIVKVYLNKL